MYKNLLQLRAGGFLFIKKLISLGLLLSVVMCMTGYSGSPGGNWAELSLSAESAILICADSGTVLYEKDPDRQMAIASITKIMTAVIALEYAEQDDMEIRFTREMTAEGSSLCLKEGEVLTLSELTAGMMCVSGNDAANAVAIGIAGSLEGFAELMNEKARSLGMSNTHFVTPSGLDHEEHYSTARDMAVLCSYAMTNQRFVSIVSEKELTVSYISPKGKTQRCANHNRLLSEYEGCLGIKTGYTKKAGRTLTSCAERDGVRLIAVTLSAPDDWNDHRKLLDYGFSVTEGIKAAGAEDFYDLPVAGGMSHTIAVRPERDIIITGIRHEENEIQTKLIMPHFVYAPQSEGDRAGMIYCFRNGKLIAGAALVYAGSVGINKQETT